MGVSLRIRVVGTARVAAACIVAGCATQAPEVDAYVEAVAIDEIAVISKDMTGPPLAVAGGVPVYLPAVWHLRRNAQLDQELMAWANQAGWTLLWRPDFSWRVAEDAVFTGSFEEAVAAVIGGLYADGEPVRLLVWLDNRVVEVVSDAKV